MNARLRTMLGFLGLSAGLLSVAGCPTGDGASDGLLPDLPAGGGGVERISDGTSNTIQFGERGGGLPSDDPTSAPSPTTGTGGSTGAGTAGSGAGGAAGSPPGETGSGAPSNAASLAAIRAALADRVFQFANSSGNSDNNAFATGVTDLQLCDFGRFGMREFTSFASSVGDFSSEDFLNGTWAVQESGGNVFVVLTIEQSTDENEPATRALLLQQDRAGTFLFDGAAADSANVAADCAASAQEFSGRGAP